MDQIPTMTLQCYAAASRGENFDVAESAPSELLGCELLMCPVLKKKKERYRSYAENPRESSVNV